MLSARITSTLVTSAGVTVRGPLSETTKVLASAYASLRFGAPFRNNMAAMLADHFIHRLKDALVTRNFPGAGVPLSPLTEGAKGHGTPLLNTMQLVTGLYKRRAGTGKYMVTYRGNQHPAHRGADKTTPLGVVAAAMEDGTSFVVTERMRNFFRAAVANDGWPHGFRAFRVGQTIHVPARAFFKPTLEAVTPELEEIAAKMLSHYLATMTPTEVDVTMRTRL